MSNLENNAMNMSNSFEKEISSKGESEKFKNRLQEEAQNEITDEMVSFFRGTEIYGKKVIRKSLVLDRCIEKTFFAANKAMIHFIEYVLRVKEDNIYQQLGYPKFEEWVQNRGISMSTVNIWQKVYDVFIKGHGFTPDEISMYDIKKLKIILPLAEMETVTKERVEELFELILFMGESDLRLSVKEEIALNHSETESNPQN